MVNNNLVNDYDMPTPANKTSRFSISLPCFDVFSANSKLAMHELLSIEQDNINTSENLLDNLALFSKRVADFLMMKLKAWIFH